MNLINGLSEKTQLEFEEMLGKVTKEIFNTGFEAGKAFAQNPSVHEQWDALPKKSPNQQRAELIQRAREFMDEQAKSFKWLFNGEMRTRHWKASFIVNEQKRTIVCLLKGNRTRHIYARGIAKCMPDEVFNADIGKAIALARALKIDVPQEFLRAVQPTEKVAGMKLYILDAYVKEKIAIDRGFAGLNECHIDSPYGERAIIIDDTNAKYEEESN